MENLKVNWDQKLYEFTNKYVKPEIKQNYHFEATNLLSDLRYLKEHAKRTKVSERFGFTILPSMEGLIVDYFLRELIYKNESKLKYEGEIVKLLKILDITKEIYKILEDTVNQEILGEKIYLFNETVNDLIEWNDVCEYFVRVDVIKLIDSFIGSNYLCEQIEDEIVKALKERDKI